MARLSNHHHYMNVEIDCCLVPDYTDFHKFPKSGIFFFFYIRTNLFVNVALRIFFFFFYLYNIFRIDLPQEQEQGTEEQKTKQRAQGNLPKAGG